MPKVDLHQGDCIDFLRGLEERSVDIITTDPAYSGMNQHLNLGKGRIVGEYATKEDWFPEFHDTADNYRVLLKEMHRVLRPNRSVYLMFDSYSLLTLGDVVREFFAIKNIICWDKVAIGMGHNFRRRHEFIVYATKGKDRVERNDIPDIWSIPKVSRPTYPTQKPVELFEAMLIASGKPGYVVCDPFMGSGSSAVAAIKRGCDFVGSDIKQESFNATLDRVRGMFNDGVDPLQKPIKKLPDWMRR